jgi:hypothetical protein
MAGKMLFIAGLTSLPCLAFFRKEGVPSFYSTRQSQLRVPAVAISQSLLAQLEHSGDRVDLFDSGNEKVGTAQFKE